MSSPGGTEVGRASIRILPDVSGFRERLRAELEKIQGLDVTVDVNFDIDPAELQAQLARLDDKITIRARIIADDPNIDQLVTLRARLDIDMVHWRAQVARINPVRLRANVDVDIDEADIARRVRRAIRRGGTDVDIDGGRGRDGIGGIVNSFSLIANFGGRWVRYLLQAFAIAPALAVAGAAIAAAWGTISTAIAAIPAALFLIAGPLAVVILGMEQFKYAFSQLTPEIRKLQSVSRAAFGPFLKDAVDALAIVLRTLGEETRRVSIGLGWIIRDVSELLAQGPKLAQINYIFGELLYGALVRLRQPIVDIVDAFIDVATIGDGWRALTKPIEEFATAFRASVSEIGNNGVLGGALRELGDLLGSVSRAFVDLVENGIYLFFQAGPGLTHFMDSITDFFSRFDWEALGTAVGAVFIGLGDTLRLVPQSTIDSIVLSFQKLGALFVDGQFQRMLRQIIGYLPFVIDLVTIMTEGFVRGILVIAGFAKAAVAAVALVADSATAIAEGWSFEEFKERNDQNWRDIQEGIAEGMSAAFDPMEKELPERLGRAGDNIFRGFVRLDGSIREGIELVEGDKDFDPWDSLGSGIGNSLTNALNFATQGVGIAKTDLINAAAPSPGDITRVGTKYQELWGVVQVNPESGAAVAANAKALANQVLTNLQPPAGSQETVGGAWSAVASSISGFTQVAIDTVNNVLATGFGQAVATTQQGAAAIPPAANTGLSALPGIVSGVMDNATGRFTEGWNASFVATDLGARRVVNRTAQVPGQIGGAIGPTSGILNNAGTNIMNSLYNGLVSAYGKVQRFISSIAGWIARNKGPEAADKALLIPAGTWIMEGLAEGLARGFEVVQAQVVGMNQSLQDSWFFDAGSFANALTEGVPEAIAKNEQLLAKSNMAVNSDLNATVASEGYGIGNDIVSALEGWEVVIDANGITKMVNKTNTRKARR